MTTSLIIGMGIGNLYAKVLKDLGHSIITVDQDVNKKADFINIEDAIKEICLFDTVHICTPNFTHEEIARKLAPMAKIVFIEKPGVINKKAWTNLITDFPLTRFIMVKNNMWRDNIAELIELASNSKSININWSRKNCIPSPGSWFTTKKLAFGGVSRDLMPHLLSLYVAMNPNWYNDEVNLRIAVTNWKLKDIESTEYGIINPNGTYDVDDECFITFSGKWKCYANWRNTVDEDSSIEFISEGQFKKVVLGWCPENAYTNMIKDALVNIDNPTFWTKQYQIDAWIHEQIENL